MILDCVDSLLTQPWHQKLVKCTICESVITKVPTERDQADSAILAEKRKEAQLLPAPLITKGPYCMQVK